MEIKVPRLFTITLERERMRKKGTEVALAAVAVIFD